MEIAKAYMDEVIEAARRVDLRKVTPAVDLLEEAYLEDRFVFTIGNGGSAAAASHLAEDLCKGAMQDDDQKRFRALSLADNTPFLTAISNDLGYERVFDFQLRQFARAGDLLIGISGSGNSPNILRAAEYAKTCGLGMIAMTGFDGGQFGAVADVHIHVPIRDMCKAEAVHGILCHMLTDLLGDRIRKNDP